MQKINKFPLKDIIISEDFKSTPPRSEKLARKEEQYKRTGLLPGIVINDAGVLIDGYIDYLLAAKYQIQNVTVTRGYTEVIEAVHSHSQGKIYRWKVPLRLQGTISVGDKVLVRASNGIRRVMVRGVFHEQYPQQNPRLEWVCCISQKSKDSRE